MILAIMTIFIIYIASFFANVEFMKGIFLLEKDFPNRYRCSFRSDEIKDICLIPILNTLSGILLFLIYIVKWLKLEQKLDSYLRNPAER